MLTAYYGLKNVPFYKSIKPDKLFISNSANELLSRLDYMKTNRGIMLVTGEAGVGKTTLIRSFINNLSTLSFKSFYAPLATVTPLDFYRNLNIELNGNIYHIKSQLFRSIQNTIKDLVNNNKITPVIVFDEAHLMKNDNFQELQLINNFNMDSHDPALIILVGQPFLSDRLARPVLKAFYQRISLKHHLLPLEKDDIKPYIEHHIKIAGLNVSPFTDGAIDAIYKNTNGNLRLIASLIIKTMTLGMLQKEKILTEEHVYLASQEM